MSKRSPLDIPSKHLNFEFSNSFNTLGSEGKSPPSKIHSKNVKFGIESGSILLPQRSNILHSLTCLLFQAVPALNKVQPSKIQIHSFPFASDLKKTFNASSQESEKMCNFSQIDITTPLADAKLCSHNVPLKKDQKCDKVCKYCRHLSLQFQNKTKPKLNQRFADCSGSGLVFKNIELIYPWIRRFSS